MIPLKEAINIFEQRKISLMRDNNPHIFLNCTLAESTGFSSYDYIIGKVYKWLGVLSVPQTIPLSMSKGLLGYVAIHYLGGKDYFDFGTIKGLFLYGKSVRYNDYNEIENIDHNYTRTKKYFYADKSSKHKPCIETCVGYLEDQDYIIFENYNYNEIYNPSINYTVQGNKESNIIKYIDISVDENELKTFLDSDIFDEKLSPHMGLINNAIDKYIDKVNKVFRETIEKEKRKDPQFIPFNIGLTPEGFDEIAITKTFDEYLDKHIERQEEYNRNL